MNDSRTMKRTAAPKARMWQALRGIPLRAIALRIALCCCAIMSDAHDSSAAGISSATLTRIDEPAPAGYAAVRGVSAGAFLPDLWAAGPPSLLPDHRHPLIEPLPGNCRNIYAPSAVETAPGEWRVFYGAWDGTQTGSDRIYSIETGDFLSWRNRHTVIEHGVFHHVCNVSALRLDSGQFSLMCTAYPDGKGLNKPAFFASPDGRTWNGSPAPYAATTSDIVSIRGYDKYGDADINGMNVILHEDGKYRLYFCNFRDFGKVYRASGTDGRKFDFEGDALRFGCMVNDVKKFAVDGRYRYLMGMHANTDKLFYSLSSDGMGFDKERVLMSSLDAADRYIVAIGWVTTGAQETPGRRVLGLLYGAGAVPSLDQNRIFARWLQRKVVVTLPDGSRLEGTRSLGPDTQLVPVTGTKTGRVEILAEDGKTVLASIPACDLAEGKTYVLPPAGTPAPR